jgi:AcrR family transcriptional regulator
MPSRQEASVEPASEDEQRRPPRRSDRTRAAILAAARRHFSREGYERATIRAIAADARIDPSMVIRYFGSKQQLFAAAADIDLRLPHLPGYPRSRLGATLMAHFLRRWEGGLAHPVESTAPGAGSAVDARADEALLVLLRAAVTNEAAAERMRTILHQQVAVAVASVAPDAPEARAGMVATQVLGLALCRYVLRLPSITDLEADTLVARFGPTLQRYLTAPLPR